MDTGGRILIEDVSYCCGTFLLTTRRPDAEGWVWDESLFAGGSAYYDRGRIPCPPGLRDAFASVADLHGSPRLIDVGCGPGSLRLVGLFAGVVGHDPRGRLTVASVAGLFSEQIPDLALVFHRRP